VEPVLCRHVVSADSRRLAGVHHWHAQSLGVTLRSVTELIDDSSTGKLMEGGRGTNAATAAGLGALVHTADPRDSDRIVRVRQRGSRWEG
jgi:hypothetical protein